MPLVKSYKISFVGGGFGGWGNIYFVRGLILSLMLDVRLPAPPPP